MTIRGNESRLFLDNVDLSCVTASLSVETATGELPANTLCSTADEFVPGARNGGSIGVSGYFTSAAIGGEEEALFNALSSTSKTVGAIFDYSNLPAVAYCLQSASNYQVAHTVPFDGLITLDASFRNKYGLKRGLLGYYKQSITGVGTSAAVQIPGTLVGSSGKFFAFLHTITGTASTPILFAVQSSANGSTGWASEASFSFAAVGADVKDFTTPAGAYFSISTTSMGGATGFTVSIVFVVDGVTN